MVLMIVSGRSGSGKSVALRALEDMGFYCVDNLPVVLLPDLARSLADRNISAAVSIDVRNMPESPEIFEQAMQNLPECFSPQLLFLDADRNTLIRRYSGIDTNEPPHRIEVEGQFPPRPYYQPRDLQGNPIDIRKVKPKTDTACTHCGLCAPLCPMGAIDERNTDMISGVCIKCCACVKGCPTGAKFFDDAGYLYHQHELEAQYAHPAENEVFYL